DHIDDRAYEVDFLNCVVDKENNFKIVDSDSHFCEFVGIHHSKIKSGKLFLQDIIVPADRQEVLQKICKKDSPYIYMDFDMINKDDSQVFVHCTAQNYEDSALCRLVFADVSKSREKTIMLRERANEINHLIDLVTGGVCLFKVTEDMHFETFYLNAACRRLFDTDKEKSRQEDLRIDDLIHPQDKTIVFQAIGRAMATGDEIDLECRIMPRKNMCIWCKCNAAVHRIDADGCPVFHAVFTDITNLKNAEKRADEANDRLVNLLTNLSGAVFFTTPDKPFECDLISGDFAKLINYSRAEFFERFGGDLSEIIADEKNLLEEKIKRQISQSETSEITYEINKKGAGKIRVKDSRKLIHQEDGSMALICELFEEQ
ncbi:MAG: PAS domain-containing protein, partial [Clostridiales bacterium]|nr:PAS domain-containing protein [Clostridiales bacterium]